MYPSLSRSLCFLWLCSPHWWASKNLKHWVNQLNIFAQISETNNRRDGPFSSSRSIVFLREQNNLKPNTSSFDSRWALDDWCCPTQHTTRNQTSQYNISNSRECSNPTVNNISCRKSLWILADDRAAIIELFAFQITSFECIKMKSIENWILASLYWLGRLNANEFICKIVKVMIDLINMLVQNIIHWATINDFLRLQRFACNGHVWLDASAGELTTRLVLYDSDRNRCEPQNPVGGGIATFARHLIRIEMNYRAYDNSAQTIANSMNVIPNDDI